MPVWTSSFTTTAEPLTFRNGANGGYFTDTLYPYRWDNMIETSNNKHEVGVYLDSDIDSKIKKYLKKAIGETLRELKMNVSEEEFFRILEEKADV